MSKEKEIEALTNRIEKLNKKLESIGTTYVGHGIYESRQDIDIMIELVKAFMGTIKILEKRINQLEKELYESKK
jgi:polyhydroxyalkanoate synthesis regulator phasin